MPLYSDVLWYYLVYYVVPSFLDKHMVAQKQKWTIFPIPLSHIMLRLFPLPVV
jgi:hypothetical protein